MAAVTAVGIFLVLALGKIMEGTGVAVQPEQATGSEIMVRAEPELSHLICNAAGFANSFVGAGLIVSSLSLILQQRIGSSVTLGSYTFGIATIAGLVLAIRWISNLVVSPVTGKIIDRAGRRRPFLILAHTMVLLLLAFALTRSPVMTIVTACFLFLPAMPWRCS